MPLAIEGWSLQREHNQELRSLVCSKHARLGQRSVRHGVGHYTRSMIKPLSLSKTQQLYRCWAELLHMN